MRYKSSMAVAGLGVSGLEIPSRTFSPTRLSGSGRKQ
jgi:hypothetical protein